MFDRVIMIDWAAGNRPTRIKPKKDAVWGVAGSRQDRADPVYFRTRAACMDWLRQELSRPGRTLVGFDFPFGYPARDGVGTMPVGRELCYSLAKVIHDNDRNQSNRFDVAANLNMELANRFGGDGPFWGCPSAKACDSLTRTKPSDCLVPEYRTSEEFQRKSRGASPKSAWQLLGNGSVGSQSLLGLAAIGQLLLEESLARRSKIWPFETGWGDEMQENLADDAVVFAEIYPSLFNDRASTVTHEIHDARQVVACRDVVLEACDDAIAALLTAPKILPHDDRVIARDIEGWILGVR